MVPHIKQQVAALMKRVREGRLPSSETIVDETFRELGFTTGKIPKAQARRDFNDILYRVWQQTLLVLERYEEKAYALGIPTELVRLRSSEIQRAEGLSRNKGFAEAIKSVFEDWYPYLREAFLSVSQSRKTRGGRDFELQFGRLLDLAGIPYQKIARTYRVDFMIPGDAAFRANPTIAAIASAKRTLRERWREVVEELVTMRSPNIFLVTADMNVSQGHVNEICQQHRIHLVVWDVLKASKFPNEPLVLGYTEWINQRLPALEQFWPHT